MFELLYAAIFVLFVLTIVAISKISSLQAQIEALRWQLRSLQNKDAPQPRTNTATTPKTQQPPIVAATAATKPTTGAAVPPQKAPGERVPDSAVTQPLAAFENSRPAETNKAESEQREFQFIARWAPRIGISLAIAAVVFFGVYIALDTPPWVKFLQMAAVSLAICGGGVFLLSRTRPLAVALIGAGLASLYLTMVVGYAIPAVRVFPNIVTAAAAQGFVIALLMVASIRLNAAALAVAGICAGFLGTQLLALEGFLDGVLPAATLLTLVGLLLIPVKKWTTPALIAALLYQGVFGAISLIWSDHFSHSTFLCVGPLGIVLAGWLLCGSNNSRACQVIKVILITSAVVLVPIVLHTLDHPWFNGYLFAAMAILGAFALLDERRKLTATARWATLGGLALTIITVVRLFDGDTLVFLLAFETLLLLLICMRVPFPGLYPSLILSWLATAGYGLFLPFIYGEPIGLADFLWPVLPAAAILALTLNHLRLPTAFGPDNRNIGVLPTVLLIILLILTAATLYRFHYLDELAWAAVALVAAFSAVAQRSAAPVSLLAALLALSIGVGVTASSPYLDTLSSQVPALLLLAIAIAACPFTRRGQAALYCITAFGLLQWIHWPVNCMVVPLLAIAILAIPLPQRLRSLTIAPVVAAFTTIQIFIDHGGATATVSDLFPVLQASLLLLLALWFMYSMRQQAESSAAPMEQTAEPSQVIIAFCLLILMARTAFHALDASYLIGPETLAVFGIATAAAAWRICRSLALPLANIALGCAVVVALTIDLNLTSLVLVALSFTAVGLLHFYVPHESPPPATLWPYYAGATLVALIVCSTAFTGNPVVITPTWGIISGLLLVIGLKLNVRPLRITGLIGIGICVVRLIGVDLQDTFYRIIAFAVLASVCIAIGYLYQRKIR